MRVTILFVLVACILGLTFWAWYLTPQRTESLPLSGSAHTRLEEIQKINSYTDIELLRDHARRLVFNPDTEAFERDMVTLKAGNILALATLLSIICLIILFFEIAARGRNYQGKTT